MKHLEKRALTALETKILRSHKTELIAYCRETSGSKGEAVRLVLNNDPEFAWRAASLLWSSISLNDPEIRPFVPDLIQLLPSRPQNQQREILKILHRMEIPENRVGVLFDAAESLFLDPAKQSSVRFNAFQTLIQMATRIPDLLPELLSLGETHTLENLSPAIQRAIREDMENLAEGRKPKHKPY